MKNIANTISGPDAVINMDVCQYAQAVAARSRNGMSRDGTHRVIGEIPLDVYHELVRQAAAHGESLTGSELKQYLHRHPEYRTVAAIDSGNTRNAQCRVNI